MTLTTQHWDYLLLEQSPTLVDINGIPTTYTFILFLAGHTG